jgi:hypothetical protein
VGSSGDEKRGDLNRNRKRNTRIFPKVEIASNEMK